MKYGFIGLGAMGKPMSANLEKEGYDVIAYDANPQAVQAACVGKIQPAQSAEEVAENAQLIFLSLPNASIVQSVMDQLCKVEKKAVECVIDLSTISPESSKKFAAQAMEKQIRYIDCPVSGGVTGAAAGTLTMMFGGDEETLKTVEAPMRVLGKNIYCTGKVGSGAATKMLNNYLAGISAVAVCEVMALATKLGLNLKEFIEIVNNSSGRSGYTQFCVLPFLEKRNFTPGFSLDLFHKDISLSMETSRNMQFPLFMGAAAQECMEMARAFGYGKEDVISIVKLYEQMAGVKVNE